MAEGNRHRKTAVSNIDEITSVSSPDGSWLQPLFSRRVIFVLGKGGAGKTTAAIALGLAARRMNKRVLVVEIGDSDAVGGLCLDRTLSETPEEIFPALWGVRVHPKSELEAYIRAHVGSSFISRKIIRSRLFSYLMDATPGLKEVMSLGRIWRLEQEKTKQSQNRFDLIIVDAPATGHAMSLLRLPGQLVRMIRVGPVANQIREIERLFKNPQKSCLAMVTLPEELPVNEAMELYAMAEDELEMPFAVTFINCVYPSVVTKNEADQIDFLKDRFNKYPDTPNGATLDAALRIIHRRDMQQKYIDQVAARAPGKIREIPFYFTNDLTFEHIEALSQALFPSSFISDQA